jgi:flagellar assembly protein FliH
MKTQRMTEANIQLPGPLRAVTVTDSRPPRESACRQAGLEGRSARPQRRASDRPSEADAEQAARLAELQRATARLAEEQRATQAEGASLVSARQALTHAAQQVEGFRAELLAEAEGQLLTLAVEIARKVLMQEIQAERYQIDPIVAEALRRVPSHGGVVVHLNPGDCSRCQAAVKQEGDGQQVRFVADVNVQPAECLLETPEGIVESSVEGHLAAIAEGLGKSQ